MAPKSSTDHGNWVLLVLARAGFTAHAVRVHPDDLPPLGEIVVPDDARALDREVLAYQRELRAARRAARYGRLVPHRFHSPRAAAMVAVTVALVLAVLAGLVAVIGPGFRRTNPLRSAAPLASPTVATGKVGGLLPDVDLISVLSLKDQTSVAARALRPAAIVLVPAYCSCGPVVADVLRDANEIRLNAAVVASGTVDAELATLADPDPSEGGATGQPLVDQAGVLAKDYGVTTEPVLLALDEYGVVRRTVTLASDDMQTETAVRAVIESIDPSR
jgi:hypothetical protein